MKKKRILIRSIILTMGLLWSVNSFSQVGIGTTDPDKDAILELYSPATGSNAGGLLAPRIALSRTNQSNPLSRHVAGMMVYNTTNNTGNNNVTPGFYYNDGSKWVRFSVGDDIPSSDEFWSTEGNTVDGSQFLGTKNSTYPLRIATQGFDRFLITPGNATSGGRLQAVNRGTEGSPIYSWTGDNASTGMYLAVDSTLAFTTGGRERFQIPNNDQIWARYYGSAEEPTYSWFGAPGSGMYAYSSGLVSFATKGKSRFSISASSYQVLAMDYGTFQVPFYGWGVNDNFNTGIFLAAGKTIGFTTHRDERFRIPRADQVHAMKNGTPVRPFYSWGNPDLDPETTPANNTETAGYTTMGMYRRNPDELAFSTAKKERMYINTKGAVTIKGFEGSDGYEHSALNVYAKEETNKRGAIYAENAANHGSGVYAKVSGGNNNKALYGEAGDGWAFYGENSGSLRPAGFAKNSHATGTGMRVVANNTLEAGIAGGTGLHAQGITGITARGFQNTSKIGAGVLALANGSNLTSYYAHGSGLAGNGYYNGVYGYSSNGRASDTEKILSAAGVFKLGAHGVIKPGNGNTWAEAILASNDDLGPFTTSDSTYVKSNSYFGGYFRGGRITGANSYAYVGVQYDIDGTPTNFKIIGNGSVSTIVNDNQNVPRVLFAPETPEITFQDSGTGQLINGQVYIRLDPKLKGMLHIDDKHPLKVFITLEGDCNGVYVTDKTAEGFSVKELQKGTSNVPFSWMIIANRADDRDEMGNVTSRHVGVRMPAGPKPITAQATYSELIEIPTEAGGSLQQVQGSKPTFQNNVPTRQNIKGTLMQSQSSGNEDTVAPVREQPSALRMLGN